MTGTQKRGLFDSFFLTVMMSSVVIIIILVRYLFDFRRLNIPIYGVNTVSCSKGS